MAELVLAIGTSHTPLLCLTAKEWEARAAFDRQNKHLWDVDGTERTYDELLARAGHHFETIADPSRWGGQEERAQRCLDALRHRLAEARPDVVVIVGDDQKELFTTANFPAVSVYYGEQAVTMPMPRSDNPVLAYRMDIAHQYAMERSHRFPAAPELGLELIERLIAEGFDVGAADSVPDPANAGFGHAYGFVATRLMGERKIPMLPILINTYFPPNQPTPARCFALGAALRRALAASPRDLRVAVVASGGLSHFVTNEALDRAVIDALGARDRRGLAEISPKLLNDGSSEIRNWIVMGGAIDGLGAESIEYIPVYRTPAGTGIGMAFASFAPYGAM